MEKAGAIIFESRFQISKHIDNFNFDSLLYQHMIYEYPAVTRLFSILLPIHLTFLRIFGVTGLAEITWNFWKLCSFWMTDTKYTFSLWASQTISRCLCIKPQMLSEGNTHWIIVSKFRILNLRFLSFYFIFNHNNLIISHVRY